jgi:hypothetical protein
MVCPLRKGSKHKGMMVPMKQVMRYVPAVTVKRRFTPLRAGVEYVLQVRDITSRYGSPSYRYRILVRPEIPHVGEASVMEEGEKINGGRINLIRGEPPRG